MPASLPTQDGMLEALRLDRAPWILVRPPLAAGLALADGLAAALTDGGTEGAADGAAPPQPASRMRTLGNKPCSFMAPDCAMRRIRWLRWLPPPPSKPRLHRGFHSRTWQASAAAPLRC